jgi:hypothetical protein
MSTAAVAVEELPDPSIGDLYEVVDGRFVEKPPMGAYQGVLAGSLFAILHQFVNKRRLGGRSLRFFSSSPPSRSCGAGRMSRLCRRLVGP